ncbi:hypothetical protein CFC21_012177 [Triticum aestivum]|uniref:Small ribosomal subunit protein bS18c n=2 Tax=Triticum aestivum TaxID=4565 RepID=A0A9R1DPX2_WHEAT|nr:uncharacterized protein LOC123181911 [Triticum aestivum]XP_044450257.1 uncharacterized protein LOC123181911 [Triticum aestivum]KAF6995724.1 hypothetical protein CFC21_012177 [Triticum aestivum]
MASSALRRSLTRRGLLRRLLPSHPPPAATSSFRRSFQSEEGAASESTEDFEKRMFGNQREPDDNSFFGKLDGVGSSFGRRHGTGSGMGAFSQQGEMGNLFGGRSSHGIMDGFDSLNNGMNEKLDDAARTFHMTDEVEDDDYDFRPDVNYRRGSTYNVRDLDLTKPAAPRNPPRPQFETSTKEVLRKADFRNVRFLANFITEAGIIIKRNQTKISAKAQRKVAREIKTARALGLMPFTTMGKRPFIFGRSVEEDASEEEYGYDFVQKDAGPEDTAGDAVPDVETA